MRVSEKAEEYFVPEGAAMPTRQFFVPTVVLPYVRGRLKLPLALVLPTWERDQEVPIWTSVQTVDSAAPEPQVYVVCPTDFVPAEYAVVAVSACASKATAGSSMAPARPTAAMVLCTNLTVTSSV